MKAEILSTGDELRTGALVDTNSSYIASRLEELGLEITRHSCVGDDMESLVTILMEIGQRSEIAVITGGLGPTPDDLSSEAAAKAANVEHVFNDKAFTDIRAYFKKINRNMHPTNKKQAFFPKGARVLDNPIGTAPGFFVKINNCTCFFLPGVPTEMTKMMDEQVLPQILKMTNIKPDISIIKTLMAFGVSESMLGSHLKDIPESVPGIKVGTRAHFPEIQVKIYGRGKDKEKIEQSINKAEIIIKKRLNKWIFSDNGQSIESIVGDLLRKNNSTLSVAESCTGGLIGHMLTSVSGSSDYFLFSAVTYSNDAKINVLNVSQDTLIQHGAVSEETVMQMAQGSKKITNSTYAIATSGIAGPTGGTKEKPVGTLCIGFASPNELSALTIHLPFGRRSQKKQVFAMAALDVLRRKILGLPLLQFN